MTSNRLVTYLGRRSAWVLAVIAIAVSTATCTSAPACLDGSRPPCTAGTTLGIPANTAGSALRYVGTVTQTPPLPTLPLDLTLFFGAPRSSAQGASFDISGVYNAGSGSSAFSGAATGILTNYSVDGGTFAGSLTTTLPNGCVARREYTGPLTNAVLNWVAGAEIEGCSGASPLTFASVALPSAPPAPTTLTIAPPTQNVEAAGQSGLTAAVTANVGWTATSDQSWLTVTAGASGLGNGTITYSAEANPGADLRTGHISAAGGGSAATLTVNQAGLPNAAPSVTTGAASAVSPTAATLNGTVNPNGLATTASFQWGTTTNYGTTTAPQQLGSGRAAVNPTAALTGLTANTTYHYRLAATNSLGTTNGSDQTFTTSAPLSPPSATTLPASAIATTGATLNGTVTPNGLATTFVFQWGSTTSYGNETASQSAGAGTAAANVTSSLPGLTANTTYHFRLVATNSAGTTNGANQTFTTPVATAAPSATTVAASGVTTTAATLNGSVNPNGLATTASFQWGTTTSYGNTTPAQSLGSGTAVVNVPANLPGLTASTTYHFRVVATNSAGTTNGSDLEFTTAGPVGAAPSATTVAASGVTTTAATLNGSVNPNGLATTASFQWGTTTSYGNTTPAQSLGSGTAAVNVPANLTGLTASTTYHFRVVATNSAGTTNGSDLTFTTPAAPLPPTATTVAASGVTTTAATLNGSVNPNGLATTASFQWGTTTSYGNTTPAQSLGSGTAAVDVPANLTGLTASTTYHFRVVATNSAGTTNGSDLTFTTPAAPLPPTATTVAASGVTTTGATLNGSVNPNGLATTASFQWGTTTSYGNTTSAQSLGSGTAAVNVPASLTGLTPGTTYHFRVVATNSAGTTNGNNLTFTTQAATGTLSGTVTNAGNAAPIAGATVLVQGTGLSGTTNGAGSYTITGIPAGTYQAQTSASGFTTRTDPVTISAGATTTLSPALAPINTDITIVLTWGATPVDLDSHLTGPSGGGRFHLSFENPAPVPYASLDVDDTNSFGPETVTISRSGANFVAGTYNYFVHNYPGGGPPPFDANSVVTVSQGGVQLQQFRASNAGGNALAPYWSVFSVTLTATPTGNPSIAAVQQFVGTPPGISAGSLTIKRKLVADATWSDRGDVDPRRTGASVAATPLALRPRGWRASRLIRQ